MLSTCRLGQVGRFLLNKKSLFRMNHIKDMNQQTIRVKMEEAQNQPLISFTQKVYKPSQTIEFNREGEILLYSAKPLIDETIYFQYPYIFYESFVFLAIANYLLNPLDMIWYWTSYSGYGSLALFIPRIWYFANFKYYPEKFYLLRGGRVVKCESHGIGNTHYIYWVENYMIKHLTENKMRFDNDESNFLTEEGQLKYDLDVEGEQFKFMGINTNAQQFHFRKHGTVHQPQLFEAAIKGYNIDTTDFVINTADNIRYREGSHNV